MPFDINQYNSNIDYMRSHGIREPEYQEELQCPECGQIKPEEDFNGALCKACRMEEEEDE